MWPGKEEENVFISTLSLLPDVSVMFGKQDVIHKKIKDCFSRSQGKKKIFQILTLLVCLPFSFTNKVTLSLSLLLLY